MKRTARSPICGVIIVALLSYGCTRKQPPPPQENLTFDINRPPVEAPAEVKANDFRLNPPEVLDITVKKTNGDEGLLAIQFAPDKRLERQITITPDEGPLVLHDDGTAGDEKAGDRIFSAKISDWNGLVADQDKVLAELARKGATSTIPVFKGRDVIGKKDLDLAALRILRDRGIFRPLPFGAGGSLVVPGQSLFITDPSVVNDPVRTYDPCSDTGAGMGKWSFGYLMTAMANQSGTGVDPETFVMNWLQTWQTAQTINGWAVTARPNISGIIGAWPKIGTKLDLSKAPMKLSAIVNRIDLASNLAYGKGGGAEGRFIFTVTDGSGGGCSGRRFTVILEYGVPIHTCTGLRNWAQQWMNLQNSTLGSAQYNTALEAITEQFAAANADPVKPNGSALNQLRTDEFALGVLPWELREFQLGANHLLNPVTVKQTPDRVTYNSGPPSTGSAPQANDLATWINQNASAIANDRHTVPNSLPFSPSSHFLAGSSLNDKSDAWNAPGIVNENTRRHFSINTCNACHGGETQTPFLHVDHTQNLAAAAKLSDFLTGGGSSFTPIPNGTTYSNSPGDLARRAQVLSDTATSNCMIRPRIPVLLSTH